MDRPDFHFQQFSNRALRELAFISEYQRPSTPFGEGGNGDLDCCEELRLAFRRSRYRVWLDLGIHHRDTNLLGRRVRPRSSRSLTETVVRPVPDSGIQVQRGSGSDVEGAPMAPQCSEHALNYVLGVLARIDDDCGVMDERDIVGIENRLEPSVIAAPKYTAEVLDIRRRRRRWTPRTTRE